MSRTPIVAAVLLIGAAYCGPAAAQETFEGQIIRNIMGSLGLVDDRPPIDYRERAPLVVPPSTALPKPAAAGPDQNPAWPKDPDVEARRAASAAANQPLMRAANGGNPRLSNDELRRGTVRAKAREMEPQTGADRLERISPDQLGFKGWGKPGEDRDKIVFNGEPERTRLTQPPPGLQTPSPNQPYGKIGDDKLDDNWLNRLFSPSRVAEGRDSGVRRDPITGR